MTNILFKKGTRAEIDALALGVSLTEGEKLYFTDIKSAGIALSSSTYAIASKPKVFLTAHLAANINAGAGGALTNWTKLLDTTNSFVNTTGLYTVPYSGIYRIHVSALLDTSNAAGSQGGLAIKVNSSVRPRIGYANNTGGGYDMLSGEEFIELNIGDIVSVVQENSLVWFGGSNSVGRLNIEMVY